MLCFYQVLPHSSFALCCLHTLKSRITAAYDISSSYAACKTCADKAGQCRLTCLEHSSVVQLVCFWLEAACKCVAICCSACCSILSHKTCCDGMRCTCAGKLAHCQGAEAAYPCPYARLSFANASEAQIEEGMERLGDVLRRHQQKALSQAGHPCQQADGPCVL